MEIPYENHNIELKQSFDNDSIAKEIVAFLNAYDGKIYIGITKQRKVVGISPDNNKDKLDEIMLKVSDIVTDQISPRGVEFVTIKHILLENKDVIEIDVRKGNQFYYHKKYGMSEKGCFVREGTSAKPLTPEEIKGRYEATLNILEPDITVIPARRTSLSFQMLKTYLIGHGYHINNETFEVNYHLLTPNGKFNLMAELLADENDLVINVATFKGLDKSEYLKRQDFGGRCLLYAVEQAKNYCESLNDTYVKLGDGERKEKKMFDNEAFEQAWYNACVHNKWSENRNPAIYIYQDRLEIESNGGIPKKLTKELFFKGKSEPVNKDLFDIFLKCNLGEQSGHGVPEVVKKYGRESFRIDDNYITVIIPFDKKGFTDKNTDKKGFTVNLTERERLIIDLLKINPSLTAQKIADKIGVTRQTVNTTMKNLKEKGSVARKGSDKTGYWEILSKN